MAQIGGGGLVGILLIIGIVLFFFPEPVTSGLGIALVVAAGLLWVVQEAL
jgi:hypothetical protein